MVAVSPMKLCPCDSGKPFADCCEVYISGKRLPHTPEQLMRSRYSAFQVMDIDYIGNTMRGPALKDYSKLETENWARSIEWLGLEVVNTGMKDHDGFVEFIAKYSKDGKQDQIHERSEFHRKDGKWYYVDGKDPNRTMPVHVEKVGRNEPCVCGSGKKSKKCCG